ncbi:MAG: 2'-5' RNA ligase family protein [Anaerolineae bacterium]
MVNFIRSIFNPERRVPYSIVALLDEEHDRFIRSIWREMATEMDVQLPFKNPIPHITHLQARDIETDALHDALRQFANLQTPYIIRTTGLGIFTGTYNAVYVPVVRTPNMTAIQTDLIATLASSLEDISETHLINNWIPHITLAMSLSGDDIDKLIGIVKLLARRNFAWEFTVTRLALLDGHIDSEEMPFTVTLKNDG